MILKNLREKKYLEKNNKLGVWSWQGSNERGFFGSNESQLGLATLPDQGPLISCTVFCMYTVLYGITSPNQHG
jgi:hypothetical protein